jgi:hypothetical protein
MVLWEAAQDCFPMHGRIAYSKRRYTMGEKGSKKDKNKAQKQKKEHDEKKKEQQKAKLPAKKAA